MKSITNVLLVCFSFFLLQSLTAQKLGMSSMSALGASQDFEDCTIFYNVGESIIGTTEGMVSIYSGVLQSNSTISNASYSNLNIQFFFDANENGNKDGGEYFVDQGRISISNELFTNNQIEGINLNIIAGEYIIELINWENDNWEPTTAASINITIENGDQQEVFIGIKSTNDGPDYNLDLSATPIICGFETTFFYTIENVSNNIAESTAWVKMDEAFTDFEFTEQPDFISADGLSFGWDFIITPFNSRQISFMARSPLVMNEEDLGAILTIKAWIEEQEENEFCLTEELLCSYDPNDKLVTPDRDDNLALVDDKLYYKIRFQNTGNFYARDVVVRDTLSQLLEPTSLDLISTSHPEHLQVIQDQEELRYLEFEFRNIMLPDSTTNEPGSHGFVYFSVQPKEGIDINTVIENTGHIYFDFNPAIVTNTTRSIMVEDFPVSTEDKLEELSTINVYPNPASHYVFFSEEIQRVLLYDLSGAQISNVENTSKLNTRSIPSGVYVVKMFVDYRIEVQKIIISK